MECGWRGGAKFVFLSSPFKCISIAMIASKAKMIYAMARITGNDLQLHCFSHRPIEKPSCSSFIVFFYFFSVKKPFKKESSLFQFLE
jgi:hypothetical protein